MDIIQKLEQEEMARVGAGKTIPAFGPGDTWRQPARVVAVQPRGQYQVEITAINEDPSVHTAESGRTAPALTWCLSAPNKPKPWSARNTPRRSGPTGPAPPRWT